MSGNKAFKSDVIESKEVFKGKIINVYHDKITLPEGKSTYREIVKRGSASAILPIDGDGNIIFVRQYRHPVGDCVLEIPAGVLEKDEDPFICAKRELEEETSFKSNNIKLLAKTHSAIGFCDEMIYIYLAENLEAGEFNLDEDEYIETEKYTLSEAVDMIFNGVITDSKTMIAVLAYKALKNL